MRNRRSELAKQSRQFYERLAKPEFPVPRLFKIMGFRMGRTSMRLELDDASLELGWETLRRSNEDSHVVAYKRVGLFKGIEPTATARPMRAAKSPKHPGHTD